MTDWNCQEQILSIHFILSHRRSLTQQNISIRLHIRTKLSVQSFEEIFSSELHEAQQQAIKSVTIRFSQ